MSPIGVAGLIGLNLGLIFVLMAWPIGIRTVSGSVRVRASRALLWNAVWPLGENAGWSGEILSAEPASAEPWQARLKLSWLGRDGEPIERLARFDDVVEGSRYTMRILDDTSLDPAFWVDYREDVALEDAAAGVQVTISCADRYRGAAFMILRHFALRRRLRKLKLWAETGVYRRGGVFEHPFTQFGFAVVSVLILWPLFGLSRSGLALAVALTFVVALHELGHLAAFRVAGHRSVRMIFIPLLGGIAIGGRPYDRRFEVGFVALMGAGFSAFLVPISIAAAAAVSGKAGAFIVAFTGFLALFNLANLVPVWKFDGGQVLRQIVPNAAAQAVASCALLLAFLAVARAAGFSATVVMVAGVVLAMLSLITAGSGVKPRRELAPLDPCERAALFAALLAVFAIHAIGLLWAADRFFPAA